VLDPDTSRSSGDLVPLRATNDAGEIGLEPARLEPLTAAQEAEAAELLAALFAAAGSRRAERGTLRKAA
jgi:hypothetical protein